MYKRPNPKVYNTHDGLPFIRNAYVSRVTEILNLQPFVKPDPVYVPIFNIESYITSCKYHRNISDEEADRIRKKNISSYKPPKFTCSKKPKDRRNEFDNYWDQKWLGKISSKVVDNPKKVLKAVVKRL